MHINQYFLNPASIEEKFEVILAAIIQLESNLMTAISDFAVTQNAFNDQMDAAVTGLTADVEALNATILALQTSTGEVTAEDQASLDLLTQRGQLIADKLTALDALTPPPVPAA